MSWCNFGSPCGGCEECIGMQRAYYAELERNANRIACLTDQYALLKAYFHGLLSEESSNPQHEG